jgi:hypothetical protein
MGVAQFGILTTPQFFIFLRYWTGYKTRGAYPMPEYRFYAIKRDGHIAAPPANLDLPNDAAALTEGKKLVNGHDIEIWQGPRVVDYLTPDDK